MAPQHRFEDVARVPTPGDNVAIATRRLEAGTGIAAGERTFSLSHTVMEGHRFVLAPIAKGEALLSWGLPFGHALRDLTPGEYICNAKILNSLSHRSIDFELPPEPNFTDYQQRYELDEATFRPGRQVERLAQPGTFEGYRRSGRRGVGTRNHVAILATTSRSNGFARALADRFAARVAEMENVDGVVAVTHTEGGGEHDPNNRDFLLRALAGFTVHPNLGAVVAVDYGDEVVNNRVLRDFMAEHDYPLQETIHTFFTIEGDFTSELNRATEMVEMLLPNVAQFVRTPEPLSELKLALQCGGSDAFSGISGNPLAGWVAKEVIRNGGAANLAETDELIGAEPYVLSNVRDAATARRFLEQVERFKERAAWHGHSAEGNPSGGNQYRGLYNIALKSLGAARKKDPDVRLDYVIDYAQPMREGGYYFMDSPGNDLESIAGQVASGANLILFITGNGSITNFPFVPTLKFVTTTGRWQMLANEMDVNAGRYNDGTPMDELGRETFELAVEVASGRLSLGERAGHSQVQVWRDWWQTDGTRLEALQQAPRPAGEPLATKPPEEGLPEFAFAGFATRQGVAADQVGLVVPTSLCSAQVARMIADDLNARSIADGAVTRYVALVHTEGCGAAPGPSTQLFLTTVLGHITHPMTRKALLLEHGCEQTHNDAMRLYLSGQGVDVDQVGFASVQLDGGIEAVKTKAARWFSEALGTAPPEPREGGLGDLRMALTAHGPATDAVARGMAALAQHIVAAGGLVVVPDNSPLLASQAFRTRLLADPDAVVPTLGYGDPARHRGLHVMETQTDNFVETLTGLGAAKVDLMLAHVAGPPMQAHPMIPLLQVSADAATKKRFHKDLDRLLEGEAASPEAFTDAMLELIGEVASRRYTPRLYGEGNTDFQLARGWLGLSL